MVMQMYVCIHKIYVLLYFVVLFVCWTMVQMFQMILILYYTIMQNHVDNMLLRMLNYIWWFTYCTTCWYCYFIIIIIIVINLFYDWILHSFVLVLLFLILRILYLYILYYYFHSNNSIKKDGFVMIVFICDKVVVPLWNI